MSVIRQFAKDHDERLSENFFLREFRCRCTHPDCQKTFISEDLIESLQLLRGLTGPLTVLSGFRCKKHNTDIKGRENSFHLLGIAADVSSSNYAPSKLKNLANKIPMFANGGIGLYEWGIHVDVRGFPSRWIG